MLRNQDSLSCLELSYTGHLEDRNGEGLVEVDQSVFLRLVVEAVLVHFLWILLRVGLYIPSMEWLIRCYCGGRSSGRESFSCYNPSEFSLHEIDGEGNDCNHDTNPYKDSDHGTHHACCSMGMLKYQ